MQGRQRFLQALSHLNRNRKRCQLFENGEQHDVTEHAGCEGWKHEARTNWLVETRLRGEGHISPSCRIMPCAAAGSSLK